MRCALSAIHLADGLTECEVARVIAEVGPKESEGTACGREAEAENESSKLAEIEEIVWPMMHRSASGLLRSRQQSGNGLITFLHMQCRQAVEHRYLDHVAVHKLLAQMFTKSVLTERSAYQRIKHWHAAGRWPELIDALVTPEVLAMADASVLHMEPLLAAWRVAQNHDDVRSKLVQQIIEPQRTIEPGVLEDGHLDTILTLDSLGDLCKKVALYDDAEVYLQRVRSIREKTFVESHIETAKSWFAFGVAMPSISEWAISRCLHIHNACIVDPREIIRQRSYWHGPRHRKFRINIVKVRKAPREQAVASPLSRYQAEGLWEGPQRELVYPAQPWISLRAIKRT